MANIESWKVQEVLQYLKERFPAGRLDDYPRGNAAAHLFIVRDGGAFDPRKATRHHLMVTRQFFERYGDAIALKDALECGEVARMLIRAGDRTVDLY
jgi:hypothetical protein